MVFRRKINDTINNEKIDAVSGIYAKSDTYCLQTELPDSNVHVLRTHASFQA